MIKRNSVQKLLLLFFLFSFFFTSTNAQTGSVGGTVKDVNGTLLAGATISVVGQKKAVTSDEKGNYSLTLPAGKFTIVISYTGYEVLQTTVAVKEGSAVLYNPTLVLTANSLTGITVGSRVRDNRVKLTTPVPVDVIQTKDISTLAQSDLGQILTYAAPSFQSNRQTVSDGTDHIDPASLRGLGPDQTLVLVNGKRRHNTALVNINGTVGRGSVGTDLNAIPSAAIERIEVLRDGAAAQYGSDAIAGVINVVLKKNYKGFNISTNFGENITTQNIVSPQNLSTIKNNIIDGTNRQVDFDWGWTGNKKSYINVAGQWLKRDASNRGGIDNSPLLYYGNASLGNLPSPYTSSTSAALRTDYYKWIMDQDAAKATQSSFNRRDMIYGNSSSNNVLGFINAGTNVSSNVGIYTTFGIGHRTGDATGNYRLPAAVSQQPVKADGSLYYPDGFLPHIAPEIDDISFILGSNITAGKWAIDISNTLGRNGFHYFVDHSANASLAPSNDAQTSFDAGKLSFLQNTVNLDFSRKYDLKKAGDYFNLAFGTEYRYEKFEIAAGEPNSYNLGSRTTIGTTVSGPVYPVTGTAPVVAASTTATAPGAQVFPGFGTGDAVNAHRSVYAFYADGETKMDKLTLGTSARFESYAEQTSDKYSNLSEKFSARYEITPVLAVRGSVSNGFRAPSLHQRYFHNTSTQFVGSVAQNTLTINNQDPIARDAGKFGIDALKPEKSVDFTLGVTGKLGKNFSYTIDGYLINIKDRIVLSSAFSRSNPLVASILTGVDPSVSSVQFWTNAVDTRTKGLDIVLTERIKLRNNANLTLSLAGNINENKVVGDQHASATISSATNNPSLSDDTKNPANDLQNVLFDRQQRSRIEVAQPKSKFNFTANLSLKKWNVILRTIRWGQVTFLNTIGNDPNGVIKATGLYYNDVAPQSDQTFSAKITNDLAISYRATTAITVTVGANNIFDIYPDQNYIDPRNTLNTVYNNPVTTQALNAVAGQKAIGGYSGSRDASNRGRLLYFPNQFGFNGRYVYFRASFELGQMIKMKK
jgi:iron complex outermembrane receptor protein